MLKRIVVRVALLFLVLTMSAALEAQQRPQPKELAEALAKRHWNNSPPTKDFYANRKSAPAPHRDMSGIWDGTAEGGVEGGGMNAHPAGDNGSQIAGRADESGIAKPLPYTAAGLAALQQHKPGVGVRSVDAALANDPVNIGNPQGFPRMLLYELRNFEWVQFKNQWIYLDEFQQNYRIVWADGRPMPNEDEYETRWFGYSVGKWTDDYTFEIDTIGSNARSWLDNAGRPHTEDMKVHEIWHRIDYDTMEVTVTIDDPKYYLAKFNGLDKFIVHRLPDTYDMEEFIYTQDETTTYNDSLGGKAVIGIGK